MPIQIIILQVRVTVMHIISANQVIHSQLVFMVYRRRLRINNIIKHQEITLKWCNHIWLIPSTSSRPKNIIMILEATLRKLWTHLHLSASQAILKVEMLKDSQINPLRTTTPPHKAIGQWLRELAADRLVSDTVMARIRIMGRALLVRQMG